MPSPRKNKKMATIIIERTYRCFNDCKQSGCPSHKATLEFQSASNSFKFNLDGFEFYLEPEMFQVMVDLTKDLNRLDTCVNFNK